MPTDLNLSIAKRWVMREIQKRFSVSNWITYIDECRYHWEKKNCIDRCIMPWILWHIVRFNIATMCDGNIVFVSPEFSPYIPVKNFRTIYHLKSDWPINLHKAHTPCLPVSILLYIIYVVYMNINTIGRVLYICNIVEAGGDTNHVTHIVV